MKRIFFLLLISIFIMIVFIGCYPQDSSSQKISATDSGSQATSTTQYIPQEYICNATTTQNNTKLSVTRVVVGDSQIEVDYSLEGENAFAEPFSGDYISNGSDTGAGFRSEGNPISGGLGIAYKAYYRKIEVNDKITLVLIFCNRTDNSIEYYYNIDIPLK